MSLFLSTFVNKIDKKGRVSVPASFRSELLAESASGFVAFRSYKHAAIDCCSPSRMLRLSQSLDSLDVFSDTQDDLAASIFADAQQILLDSDGRVILPRLLLEHASIDDTVAFVGRGATFQLWKPETFENIQKQARQRMKEGQVSLKLSSAAQAMAPNLKPSSGEAS